ncbi:hypothetical protein STANM337S_05696 [Streptomyces tanashiensis]
MTSLRTPRTTSDTRDPRARFRRLGVASAAAGLLATLLAAGPAAATPDPGDAGPAQGAVSSQQAAEARSAIQSGEIPGVDEIVHSQNIEHLANVPKEALQSLNTDLAFQGKYAFAGNYDGFRIYDISNPKAPKTVAQVLARVPRTTSPSPGTCSSSPPTPPGATTRAPARRSPPR